MKLIMGRQQLPIEFKSLEEVEKAYIIHALDVLNGNKMKAAKALGITIKTLYNKLHQYDLFKVYAVRKRNGIKEG